MDSIIQPNVNFDIKRFKLMGHTSTVPQQYLILGNINHQWHCAFSIIILVNTL
jgi:hypothetical protein